MLIHHHKQRLTAANQGQQIGQRGALLHQGHGENVGSQRGIGLQFPAGNRISQPPQIEHPPHVIKGTANHRKAGVGRLVDLPHHGREGHFNRQGDHPRAGHHDLPHQGVAQRKHPFQDVALIGHQAGDTAGFNQRFQFARR